MPKPESIKLAFKPKAVTKHLLDALSDRARDAIVRRYGLGENASRETLESIGSRYGITRGRVRQIENYALNIIRKSDAYEKEKAVFEELEKLLHALGSIVPEHMLLDHITKDASTQNHIHFLLVLGHPFVRLREDEEFVHRWHVDADVATKVENALRKLYESLSDKDLIPEGEFIENFLEHLKDVSNHYRDEEVLKRWLQLSKKIGRNPLGEWGRAESPNVKLRGLRDYAYLVIRSHGSPMHFSEVANQISKLFERKAHVATAHNELIKDKRFVLVGRGLYALSEWGYMPGVVRDVIIHVLEKHGPLSREDVIKHVLKERYVKPNTILVNLQDKQFKRLKDGRYTLA